MKGKARKNLGKGMERRVSEVSENVYNGPKCISWLGLP